MRRLQNEPVLNPSPAPVKSPPPAPKDLTSSLMENNLSQMKLSKPLSQIQNQQQQQQNWRPQQITQNNIPTAQQWPQMASMPQQQPPIMQQWQQAPSLQWHTNATPVNNTISTWQSNGTINNSWSSQVNQFPNVSSLNNKTVTPIQPLISNSNQTNAFQQPVKQLSSSEINDLLS